MAITQEFFRDYSVHCRDGEVDFLGMFRDYLDGVLPTREILSKCSFNRVSMVESAGKRYIIKRDGFPISGLERKVWRSVFGPFHSSLMPKVNRAIEKGCSVIVDIFLVAEKMSGKFAEETFIIMEYAEGTNLSTIPDLAPYRGLIHDAFVELHRYGLSLGDPNPGNLVLTGVGGIKMFDFSVRGTQLTGRAKDRIKCRKAYGIDLPLSGVIDMVTDAAMLLQLKKTAFFRKLRGKPFVDY